MYVVSLKARVMEHVSIVTVETDNSGMEWTLNWLEEVGYHLHQPP